MAKSSLFLASFDPTMKGACDMTKCVCGHPKEFHDKRVHERERGGADHGPNCIGGRCGCSGFRVADKKDDGAAGYVNVGTSGGAADE